MSSAGIWSILIQFIFFPILGRIYSPEAYGTFSVFNTIVVLLGTVATLAYQRALVLPRDETSFRALLRLCIRVTCISCLIFTGISFMFGGWLVEQFNVEKLGNWVYAVGPVAFLLAIDQIVATWTVQAKAFRLNTFYTAPITLGSKLFNVGYGWLINATAEGLIVTMSLSYVARIVLFPWKVIKNGYQHLTAHVSKDAILAAKKEYSAYPRYMLWSNLLNNGSNFLPFLLFPIFLFRPDESGYYVYALVVLDLPIRLIGSGIGPVYFQKSAELWDTEPERLRVQTWKLYKVLGWGSMLLMVILNLTGEWVYTLVFGDQWTIAGAAMSVLVFSYFFRYLSVPVSNLFNVVRKERQLLYFQILLFISRVLSLIIPGLLLGSFMDILWSFTLANAVCYFILLIWCFRLIKFPVWKVVSFTLGVFTIGCAVVALIRFGVM
jgi:O-antigen/teichoic acid export membrane protein